MLVVTVACVDHFLELQSRLTFCACSENLGLHVGSHRPLVVQMNVLYSCIKADFFLLITVIKTQVNLRLINQS